MKALFRKILCAALAAALLLGLCACQKSKPEKEKFSGIFYDAFDTAISITAYCESEKAFEELFGEIKAEFLEYHKLFDIYHNYEGIVNAKTLNDSAGGEAARTEPALIELLLEAKELYAETSGHVNIAMGAVLKLWHDAREYALSNPDKAYVPDEAALQEAARHCNIEDIVIDAAAGTVQLKDALMSIDLGAVAKGFATERVAQRLMAEGRENILISAGGNARTIGAKPDGSPWVIAVQNPDKDEQNPYAELLGIASLSAVTSGSYERFYEVKGISYHHIINKDTLMPENNYKSVTILTEDSAYADALSTAIFNMSPEEGSAFIKAAPGTEAMWILSSGEKLYSDGFSAFVK